MNSTYYSTTLFLVLDPIFFSHKARIRSCGGPYAGTWLTTIPTSLPLKMKDDSFRAALRRRLGLASLADNFTCEGCGSKIDKHGFHWMACNRTGRNHWRHRALLQAWRQIFYEAGGQIPDRNIERMLRTTNILVAILDDRRLDLIVTGLRAKRGLPLFCDLTVMSPLSVKFYARSGCSNSSGALLRFATTQNNNIYSEVARSDLAELLF